MQDGGGGGEGVYQEGVVRGSPRRRGGTVASTACWQKTVTLHTTLLLLLGLFYEASFRIVSTSSLAETRVLFNIQHPLLGSTQCSQLLMQLYMQSTADRCKQHAMVV